MREIKFRVWNPTLKIMVNDVNGINIGEYVVAEIVHGMLNATYLAESGLWKDAEIMQFTGLRDSKQTKEYPNGQPIYEGDICSVINPWGEADKPCIVAYDEKVGGYTYSPEYGYGDFDISTIGWAMDIGYRFEVIGNVHDKTDLLEMVE